jgi:uncharacterized protein (DUF1501 family)
MTCTRRSFLKASGGAAFTALAPRLVFARDGKALAGSDTLVVVFQRGGMDALNAVVPYGDSSYYSLRPNLAIARPGTGSDAALDLDGFYGFHPALAPVLPLYNAGRLAVVHATGFLLGSRSHFDCQDFMERAALSTANVSSGWLNRFLEIAGPAATFQAVGIGKSVPLALRGNASTIGLSTFPEFTVATRSPRADTISLFLERLYDADTLLSTSARKALDAVDELEQANPAQYVPANGAVYPDTNFGDQMLQIAQLIKADVGLQIACVDIGGWDLHDNQEDDLSDLLDELAKALLAFDTDLGTAMANVSVVTMTDFGRRAGENASRGTDHGSGYAMFLLGGGVIGREVYSAWPGLDEAALFRGDLAITTDYRNVLSELLTKRMGGTDLAYVFPGYTQGPNIGAYLAR